MIEPERSVAFPLGQVVVTDDAMAEIVLAGQTVDEFVFRHLTGDWGEVDEVAWELNNQSVRVGGLIQSVYSTDWGDEIWIVTRKDRSVTTVLSGNEF
jgi:hypothetical protein